MRATAATVAILAAASLAVAQNQTFNIQVGAEADTPGGIYQFMPPNITAPVGSTVVFTWAGSPGNHTVTQSTASDPCDPLSGGFDSGFLFVPMNTTAGFPTWNITITDDAPIYFYCAQLAPAPHCNVGMVGSINAPATGNGSWEAVWTLAMSLNATPGQPSANAPLQAVNASVTAAPAWTGASIVGLDLPGTATASGSGSAASGASTSGASSASSGAPSPSTTAGGSSGALATAARGGAALLVSAVLGALLL